MDLRNRNRDMSLPPKDNDSDDDLAITRPTLSLSLVNGTILNQSKIVTARFIKEFNQPPKGLQVETIVSLINGFNTFLLVATGFGKSRIALAFLKLFKKETRPVIIILNPLEALGDNQVLQLPDSIPGINLTKTAATHEEVWSKLGKHHYRVIFISPEMKLNSKRFQKLYYSTDFQKHLILKVVDEAHVIYSWGLVARKMTKGLQSHNQLADVCKFRPNYGDLGQALTATDKVPVLLLSATCRPIAIKQIWNSLNITLQNRVTIQGELCRPEIRFIRIYLTRPLKTAQDISQFIPHQSTVKDTDLPSTIIYSGQQDATFTVSKEVHKARGDPNGVNNGNSDCCRIYHAATGPMDKLTRATEYGEGKFRIISATTALGLGQDWHAVESVIMMGAMDPDVMIQMAGRGGRGGKDTVAIMLVEPQRKLGQNSVEDFDLGGDMDNDDRMHAFRVTPVCLRVALNSDTLNGRIPLKEDDENYINEKKRQARKCMKPCRCSVCDPAGAIQLIDAMKTTTRADFQDLLNRPTKPMELPEFSFLRPLAMSPPSTKDSPRQPIPCADVDPIRQMEVMIELAADLQQTFKSVFQNHYQHGSDSEPSEFFDSTHTWTIMKNVQNVLLGEHLRQIFGGEPCQGTFIAIIECIKRWMMSDRYQNHLDFIAKQEAKEAEAAEQARNILLAYKNEQKEKAELKAGKLAAKEEQRNGRIQKRKQTEEAKVARREEAKEKKRLKLQHK